MTIALLFGVHAHQPVGNFPAVIEEAHLRCYRMFLQTLERYPTFRFSVHFSGWLLDVLMQRYPDDMERLKAMTQRGQVEWFGSGDCEPVLAAIPQRDRISQIETLSNKIERHFGQRPAGAWLTERVWESSVVPALVDCGIRYVAVDDYHFFCAGQPPEKLGSFWTTEEDGRTLDLFPISEQARYRLPFSSATEAVAWLERLAREGQSAAIYFDDIEKFGIWPETYEWVYEKGWLTQFIEGVLGSKLIRTATYADYHRVHATRGIVYLPTTSYIEMNEWTLPAPAARAFHRLVEQEKAAGRYDDDKSYLRGGIWRNFFSRFPEANWMHKRMLEQSARLASLPQAARTLRMQESLHRAQANDAYWHGLFGGLYLPHLRRAVWNNLLALEADLDGVALRPAVERRDVDLDGYGEMFLRSQALQAVVRDDGNAALIELSAYAAGHNFGDTLRRIDEAYHDKIGPAQQPHAKHEGIASAHDRVAFIHEIGPGDLVPDSRPRASFIDTCGHHVLDAYQSSGAAGDFVLDGNGWRVEKHYAVSGSRLSVRYRCEGLSGRFETQLNIAMPSCDGYSGRYILADGSIPCGFGQELKLDAATKLILDDSVLAGALCLSFPPASISARPYYTVSQSEAGFEKIMQGVELTLYWPLNNCSREMIVVLEYLPHAL
ncbi:Glycosyl hydrolase [Georgfuchsia toluolica]|uniref:Glycosyl hydrolase n=1 Tax=Georgfuchsia toluolica TaxID=424218 RepID=A0A916J2K4_9PROT|nr:alpha-amylase/4-alpha-glucanotransferase domain-containing protein [Georgfuchsia toluolica]CAG4883534.1 Glycosyl hydrolase [Georgfuchsia toluolica]